MNMIKKVIGRLPKCYSLAMLDYNGEKHILVAAEKIGKCLLFDAEGNLEETVWDKPGGVMSMVPISGMNGQFLATHKFYSPNDSENARIVVVTPKGKNNWEVRTLVELPFVHRFDILNSNGRRYLIACTLKSGHEYKDDWTHPGKVFAAELPDDLTKYNEGNQLPIIEIKDQMLKNHGYYRHIDEKGESAVISCEQGIFQFFPPDELEEGWVINQLLNEPASDAVLMDLDGDGKEELFTFSPFHGDVITIYKQVNEEYQKVYKYPEKVEFLHAICGAMIGGQAAVIAGHRQGKRNLLAFRFERDKGYYAEIVDRDCGSANVLYMKADGRELVISANREIDEIAMYTMESE